MAGLKAGVFNHFSDISQSWKLERAFEPQMSEDQRLFHLDQWKTALNRAKSDI